MQHAYFPNPLAYFLTWTTYGTWLPGDPRGWFSKPGMWNAPDPERRQHAAELMTETPVTLTPLQREIVEQTIHAHCQIRNWGMFTVSCRSNHVHVVVQAPNYDPKIVMEQFKAWCTRKLKEHQRSLNVMEIRENWWSQGGSKRWVFHQMGLDLAHQYVAEFQDLPREEG